MHGLKSAILTIFQKKKAEMAVPCQYGPQKVIIAFEKYFLFWVPINTQKDWKAKLESAYYFMLNILK